MHTLNSLQSCKDASIYFEITWSCWVYLKWLNTMYRVLIRRFIFNQQNSIK